MVVLEPIRHQSLNLAEKAAEALRRAIITGEIAPGARLVEEDIAAQLGVSRMPVRQAIQQLTDEGLVEKISGKGAFVQGFSAKSLDELYSLRVVLERFAVELLMNGPNGDRVDELVSIVERMQRAAQAGDHRALFELDAEFH